MGGSQGLLAPPRVKEQKSHNNLRSHDPRCDPSNLMMRVVLIQVRCVNIVDDATQDTDAINDEEEELCGQREVRPSGAKHDAWRMVSELP